jgi:hypothetical protein
VATYAAPSGGLLRFRDGITGFKGGIFQNIFGSHAKDILFTSGFTPWYRHRTKNVVAGSKKGGSRAPVNALVPYIPIL